jgi:hypothetical protein
LNTLPIHPQCSHIWHTCWQQECLVAFCHKIFIALSLSLIVHFEHILQDMDLIRRCPWNCRVPGTKAAKTAFSHWGIRFAIEPECRLLFPHVWKQSTPLLNLQSYHTGSCAGARSGDKNKRLKNCVLDLPSSTKKNTTLNSKS